MAVTKGPSAGVSVSDPSKTFTMPSPPPVVSWRNAPGCESSYAIVTKVNRHSVNLAVVAPDSRVLVPKDGVRFVDDPWNRTNGISADSGVWDYTFESKQFLALQATVADIALKNGSAK